MICGTTTPATHPIVKSSSRNVPTRSLSPVAALVGLVPTMAEAWRMLRPHVPYALRARMPIGAFALGAFALGMPKGSLPSVPRLGHLLQRLAAHAIGDACVYPEAASASVAACLAEHAAETVVTDVAAVWQGIELCAEIAADAICSTQPSLNRASVRRALSQELWAATQDIATLSRSGAELT